MKDSSSEPYLACPYCLTKIEEPNPKTQIEIDGLKKTDHEKEQQTKEKTEKPQTCQYHLGYLSERTQKDQIPEACLVCKNIIDCMLRKMRE